VFFGENWLKMGYGERSTVGMSGTRVSSMLKKITVFFVICFCGLSVQAKYSGGTGEPNNPYQIADANDMNEIGTHSEDMSAHFILVNDINLAAYTGTQFNIIGSQDIPFTGVFDGNGHTISNFTYRAINESYIGLFGYIDSPFAEIKHLGLIDPNVVCETFLGNHRVGSLTANINQGTIVNCYAENCNVLNLYQIAGGLVASSEGEIINCHTSGSVYGGMSAGGLVAICKSGGIITECYSKSNTTGEDEVGGLVGTNLGTISRCNSSGTVSGSENIGGLAGENFEGIISQSNSTASVSGDIYVGGLVGLNNTYGYLRKAQISNCYSTGSVVGHNYVAGLVGKNLCSAISYCYSTGLVDATVVKAGLVASTGGCLDSTCTNSFWDKQTSQTSWSRQGISKTTKEMMQGAKFANWDFVEIWNIGENQTYPYLRVYPAGDLNHDGIVNFSDFAILANHWLAGVE
jgi:hypothetical protein